MERYIVMYRYRDMEKCESITYNSNLNIDRPAFKARVQYKIYKIYNSCGKTHGKMICHKKKRIYCDYNNAPLKQGEINPLLGLEYEDLSKEVREQILVKKIKELTLIDIKLFDSKWSPWEQIFIDIKDE